MSDKFALIAAEPADDHEQLLPVGLMCRGLRVSRSGFYYWVRSEPSASPNTVHLAPATATR